MSRKPLRSRAWFDNPEHPDMTALYVERHLYLIRRGVHALPCIGDGRQSGASASPPILNASPRRPPGSRSLPRDSH